MGVLTATAGPRGGKERITVMNENRFSPRAEEALRLAELFGCGTAILKEKSPSCGSGLIHDGGFAGGLAPGDGVTTEVLKAHGIRVLGESQVGEL